MTASPSGSRHKRKWDRVFTAFQAGDVDWLQEVQRSGARGRILGMLMQKALDTLGVAYEAEPVFQHVEPTGWYVEFAQRHDLVLRVDETYNPDFLLGDGTWLEVTLSENTAYKKLFRHGHQVPRLEVVWLDPDDGLHKQVCQAIPFPNATVRPVDHYFPCLKKCDRGVRVIRQLERLRRMRHRIQ